MYIKDQTARSLQSDLDSILAETGLTPQHVLFASIE